MVLMLVRLAAAREATTGSLQAARDFAANTAHEASDPQLPAMRADLEHAAHHDLPPQERDEVVKPTCPARSARSNHHHCAGSAGVGAIGGTGP